MVRDPFAQDVVPELQDVLDALDDPDCRQLVRRLDEPKTARELSEACDMPLSTTYRKLELLSTASLVDERTQIRAGGHHTTQYALDFEAVHIALDAAREFEVSISRPPRAPDEQLAQLWSEVRRET
ncbi:MAG: helix-turn-helix domain-containing protein [Halobacteriales archaeon]